MRRKLTAVLFLLISMTLNLFFVTKPRVVNAYECPYVASDYTDNPYLQEKLDNVFNGNIKLFTNSDEVYPLGSRIDNFYNFEIAGEIFGWQCYAYGQAVYYYLFGDIPVYGNGHPGYFNNSELVLSREPQVSYEMFKEAGVNFGSYLRLAQIVNDNQASGHSVIVMRYDEDCLEYISANNDGKGLVEYTKVTWEAFNYSLKYSERVLFAAVSPNEAILNDVTEPVVADIRISDVSYHGFMFDADFEDESGIAYYTLSVITTNGEKLAEEKARINGDSLSTYIYAYDYDMAEGNYFLKITIYDNMGLSSEAEIVALLPEHVFSGEKGFYDYDQYAFGDTSLYLTYDHYDMLWAEANYYANTIGGYLVSITDMRENAFVLGLMNKSNLDKYYIGVRINDNRYEWCDGSGFYRFSNWNSEYSTLNGRAPFVTMYTQAADYYNPGCWFTDYDGNLEDVTSTGYIVEIPYDYFTPEAIYTSDGSTYYFIDATTTYDIACLMAERYGGSLLSIDSISESDYIRTVLASLETSDYFVDYKAGAEDMYVLSVLRNNENEDVDYTVTASANTECHGFIIEVNSNGEVEPDPEEPETPDAHEFISRLYNTALGRDAYDVEVDYWFNSLMEGALAGDIAHDFVFSDENIERELTDEEYIMSLYAIFFGREVDSSEIEYWVNALNDGGTREDAFRGFINAPEWIELCEIYRINHAMTVS